MTTYYMLYWETNVEDKPGTPHSCHLHGLRKVQAFLYADTGFNILQENYRAARKSYKLDLEVGNHYQIELFSFPDPAPRPSRPEAAGLRHLAFEVDNIDDAVAAINADGVVTEPIRIDEFTGKRFTFFADPDGLPIEFYER